MMPTLEKLCCSNPLLRIVIDTILSERLILPEDSILAAVSGGPDSVALLYLLHLLRPKIYSRLGVAHLNHCLRAEDSKKDAVFVADLCKKFKIPFYQKTIDVKRYAQKNKSNLEEAGRICRYDFFSFIAQKEGYNKIALGHHADDNAELILMRILRGSGSLGISGMSANRDGKFIRPLLKVSKVEILKYLEANQIEYHTDTTNADISLTRNRIRHLLIPDLEKNFNPNIVKALNRLATVVKSEDDWMSQTTEEFFCKALVEKSNSKITLSRAELGKMHSALARRVLRKTLVEIKGSLKRIGHTHIDTILKAATSPKRRLRLNLPDKILVEYNNSLLEMGISSIQSRLPKNKVPNTSQPDFRYFAAKPQFSPTMVQIRELNCQLQFSYNEQNYIGSLREAGQNVAFFDMDRLTFPLIIRNFKPGDRFSPLGLNGSQKLKHYFINNKVPQSMRRLIPVVESAGRIIWIAGYRCSQFSRVRPQTRQILRAEIFLPCVPQ